MLVGKRDNDAKRFSIAKFCSICLDNSLKVDTYCKRELPLAAIAETKRGRSAPFVESI